MKWKWAGPLKGGITQSMMNMFLQDPYCFVLYYGLGLEEPTAVSQEILWGNIIHRGLEHSIRKPNLQKDFTEHEWEDIFLNMKQESNKEMHTAPTSYYSAREMLKLYDDRYKERFNNIDTEVEFQIPHNTGTFDVTLMGKADGVCDWTLIEHKSKKTVEIMQLKREIKYDVQVNYYCWALDTRHVIYDVFIVPEFQYSAPERNGYERDASYINRLYHTHSWKTFPVSKNKPFWLYQFEFTLTTEWIKQQFAQTINPIIDRICMLYEYTSSDSFDPHNPGAYNYLFYRSPIRLFDPARTDKYKSSYWNYLVGDLDITELRETPKLFKELNIGQ